MRISWTEKKSNEEVKEMMAGYKRSLLKIIRKRQLQCCGHINRADGLEKQILSGMIYDTSGELTTERVGRPSDLAHDDDREKRLYTLGNFFHMNYLVLLLAALDLQSKRM